MHTSIRLIATLSTLKLSSFCLVILFILSSQYVTGGLSPFVPAGRVDLQIQRIRLQQFQQHNVVQTSDIVLQPTVWSPSNLLKTLYYIPRLATTASTAMAFMRNTMKTPSLHLHPPFPFICVQSDPLQLLRPNI